MPSVHRSLQGGLVLQPSLEAKVPGFVSAPLPALSWDQLPDFPVPRFSHLYNRVTAMPTPQGCSELRN